MDSPSLLILLYIASSLRSYCQLAYTSSLIPKTYIHVGTFLKSLKDLICLTFIAINLPTAYALTVLPCILDKSDHISQWISQKQSDFMRKIFSLARRLLSLSSAYAGSVLSYPYFFMKFATPGFFRSLSSLRTGRHKSAPFSHSCEVL